MSDILKPLIGIAATRPLTRGEAEAAFTDAVTQFLTGPAA